MRLRTTPNYTPLFTALGVSLVTTAPGEVLTALERGVVDGYGWPAIGMFDLGWGAHTKYRVDPGFYNVIVNVVVNQTKWNSLREDQRAFLEQDGGLARDRERALGGRAQGRRRKEDQGSRHPDRRPRRPRTASSPTTPTGTTC